MRVSVCLHSGRPFQKMICHEKDCVLTLMRFSVHLFPVYTATTQLPVSGLKVSTIQKNLFTPETNQTMVQFDPD